MGGAVFPPCWLFGLEPAGHWVGLMVASRRVHHQGPWSCSEPQLPPASKGDPPILAGKSTPVPYRVTAFFPSGSWCAKDPVCSLQEWSFCFLQACGIPVIKPHWPSKADSLGVPLPVAGPQGWEAWHGAHSFTSVGEFLWYNCFPVCHPPSMNRICFHHDCASSTISLWLLWFWM